MATFISNWDELAGVLDALPQFQLPSNAELLKAYSQLFEIKNPFVDKLRDIGVIRAFTNYKSMKNLRGSWPPREYVPPHHDIYVARSRVAWLKHNGISSLRNRFENMDDISEAYLFQLINSSILASRERRIPWANLFSGNRARKALIDLMSYRFGLFFHPLSNTFEFFGRHFYKYAPAANAVLYDHGFLESDAPRLPMEYDAVFDAGAFVGDSAIVLSDYLSSAGKIFSFEPSEYQKYIFRNARLNGVSDKVEVIPQYVGDGSGNSISLSDFSKKRGLSRDGTYLLKADIEGYERQMLSGAKDFIRKYTPVLLIAAYHLPDDLVVLFDQIMDAYDGYKIYFRHHQSFSPLIEYYYIAIPDTLTD